MLFKIICVLSVISLANAITDLPSFFPRCRRHDPNLNECMLKAAEQVKPYLRKGIAELKIPALSPFTIPKVTLELGGEGQSLNYKSYLKNVTIWGLDNYKFTKFDVDLKNLKFMTAVEMPYLYMTGIYELSGRILIAPIEGRGNFYNNITNSNGILTQNAKIVKKNGKEYIKPYNTVTKIHVGEVIDYGMDGLFEDNESLRKATDKLIKDNLRNIVEEMVPAVEKIMTRIFEDVVFKAVAQVPYDKLYPVD